MLFVAYKGLYSNVKKLPSSRSKWNGIMTMENGFRVFVSNYTCRSLIQISWSCYCFGGMWLLRNFMSGLGKR